MMTDQTGLKVAMKPQFQTGSITYRNKNDPQRKWVARTTTVRLLRKGITYDSTSGCEPQRRGC
eukprot:10504937-Prorocentrum_lima.AAC.1